MWIQSHLWLHIYIYMYLNVYKICMLQCVCMHVYGSIYVQLYLPTLTYTHTHTHTHTHIMHAATRPFRPCATCARPCLYGLRPAAPSVAFRTATLRSAAVGFRRTRRSALCAAPCGIAVTVSARTPSVGTTRVQKPAATPHSRRQDRCRVHGTPTPFCHRARVRARACMCAPAGTRT
jgi:hypothetical protein